MKIKHLFFFGTIGLATTLAPGQFLVSALAQADQKSLVLVPMNAEATALVKANSSEVTFKAATNGLEVTIAPGEAGYPGFNIAAPGGAWDLSEFGHVAATITNTSDKTINLSLRVDNGGRWQDEPWNTEATSIKAGETKTVKVIFGHSYNFKKAYALDPSKVINLQLFSTKSKEPRTFRVESIVASGPKGEKPPIDPNTIRLAPPNGFMLGGGAKVDEKTQLSARGGQVSLSPEGALRLVADTKAKDPTATFKIAQGRWDLREYMEVRALVKNEGQTPVTPRIRVDSNKGSSSWFAAPAPLAPGATAEIVVPFTNNVPVDFSKPETGKRLGSDAVSGVVVGTVETEGERVVSVSSIRASLPPAPVLASWVGKRPPVEGAWKQTFNEDFNGKELDLTKWNPYAENYWDKPSHFSKDNVILENGVVKLRIERKRGRHNDAPDGKETNIQTGFLDTYDKWTQKYGYFEARMKLPKAPGLWPAFWMMPDRGRGLPGGPEKWRRQDTNNNGMEFDIMEALTGWGPNRFNIAMHWNGYGKDHKAIGTEMAYLQPDAQGFITVGLLWTPGSAVYYGNGVEMARWDNPRITDVPSHLMFTHVTGGWANLPLDETKLPDDFVLDYVRAWQRDDLAALSTGNTPAQVPVTAVVPTP